MAQSKQSAPGKKHPPKQKPKGLTCLNDLTPSPYNPRSISDEAASGLGVSIEEFGDLSGIVWNAKSGHLVAGHQRVAVLKAKGAELQAEPLALVLDGREFPIRVTEAIN